MLCQPLIGSLLFCKHHFDAINVFVHTWIMKCCGYKDNHFCRNRSKILRLLTLTLTKLPFFSFIVSQFTSGYDDCCLQEQLPLQKQKQGHTFLYKKNARKSLKLCVFTCVKTCKLLIFSVDCGERGIRTPGTSRYDGFQDRCNRPLYHLSLMCVPKSGCKGTTFPLNIGHEVLNILCRLSIFNYKNPNNG